VVECSESPHPPAATTVAVLSNDWDPLSGRRGTDPGSSSVPTVGSALTGRPLGDDHCGFHPQVEMGFAVVQDRPRLVEPLTEHVGLPLDRCTGRKRRGRFAQLCVGVGDDVVVSVSRSAPHDDRARGDEYGRRVERDRAAVALRADDHLRIVDTASVDERPVVRTVDASDLVGTEPPLDERIGLR